MSQSSFFLFPSTLNISDCNLYLAQSLDSLISKYQLPCLSLLPSKRGCLSASTISFSPLQSLLPKQTVPGSIQPHYVSIITACPISKPKLRLIVRQKKTFTCDVRHILKEVFDTKKAVSVSFPSTLTNQLS